MSNFDDFFVLLYGGTAVSTVDLLTGANIASASTINLNAATGNRTHITGSVTINVVELTRGPRTVIFDGILTLAHNATTNNLPSAANITTAAGDRAIYESDGTTVYCISYFRANGEPLIIAGPGLVHLQTVIASAASTMLVGSAALLNTDFDKYKIEYSNLTFTVVNSFIFLRISIATTVQTGTSYNFATEHIRSNSSTETITRAENVADMKMLNGGTQTGSQNVVNIAMTVTDPANTTFYKPIEWVCSAVGSTGANPQEQIQRDAGAGLFRSTSAVDGIQLRPNSGTVTGVARLYGVTDGS